jgi:cytochrome b pre-mRNA-processing protein 3
MLLKRLFSRMKKPAPVRSVYEAIVALARQPALYTELQVPDTVDGRFDMIIIHADAVITHLQAGSDADQAFAQELLDEIFRDMDRSLREMGVGDMGVGKRVKKMATVYFGRVEAYARAREAGLDELQAAVLRNVYAGNDGHGGNARRLAHYQLSLHDVMRRADTTAIRGGTLEIEPVRIPQPEEVEG